MTQVPLAQHMSKRRSSFSRPKSPSFGRSRSPSLAHSTTRPPPSGAPVCEGYLGKQNRRGQWQRRFFVLIGDYLQYYENDAEKKRRSPKDFSLQDLIAIELTSMSGGFYIELKCVYALQLILLSILIISACNSALGSRQKRTLVTRSVCNSRSTKRLCGCQLLNSSV